MSLSSPTITTPNSRRLLPIKPSSNSAALSYFGLNKHKQRSKGSGRPLCHYLSYILRGLLGCWLSVGTPQGCSLEQNIYKHPANDICRRQLSPCSLLWGQGRDTEDSAPAPCKCYAQTLKSRRAGFQTVRSIRDCQKLLHPGNWKLTFRA